MLKNSFIFNHESSNMVRKIFFNFYVFDMLYINLRNSKFSSSKKE